MLCHLVPAQLQLLQLLYLFWERGGFWQQQLTRSPSLHEALGSLWQARCDFVVGDLNAFELRKSTPEAIEAQVG